ncbi:hypothetical protein DL93DRAFT_1746887 [Clavulina sp. PMI_390]|nr:hypothetical protein DL93DRAFT_1746887 [Clavulina sp. PMI_390]
MGRGFDVQLAGTQPLVCIVPSNEKELLISQLPPLALRGSAVALDRKPLLPVQAISMHPEMLPNTDIHAIRLFEGWKPPSMQPGLAVIYCFKHKHFMSLQSENSELTVQLSVIDTSLDAITKYPRLGRHPRLGDWVYELEDVKDGMDHVQLKGHSLHGEEIQCRVNRALPLSSIWPRGGHPSPLCLYSGAALVYIADMSIDDPTKSVWVIRIDGF